MVEENNLAIGIESTVLHCADNGVGFVLKTERQASVGDSDSAMEF